MTLTEFLLAQIAEVEAAAEREHLGWTMEQERLRWVLAECEAKRQIVKMQAANDEDRYLPGFHYKAQMIERVLRTLALPYAGRAGYREEWKP